MLEAQLAIAWHALGARRARSWLTVSTVAIGCFAIVLASSLAESGLSSLKQSIEELGGARIVLFEPKPPERAEKKLSTAKAKFTEADRAALSEGMPHVEALTHYAPLGEHDVLSDSGRTHVADLVAADESFFDLFRMRVEVGRPLLATDTRAASEHCVVGPKLAEKAWSEPALGRRLRVGGLSCRVVGVFADNNRWGTNFGFDWNDLVVVPHRMAALRLPDVDAESGIVLRTDAPAANDIVKRLANARLSSLHGGIDDYAIYDLGQAMERFETTFLLLKFLVGLFAGIALFIGGVGIMNMMLVSVSERVREIGLRKALGAAPANISLQFLIEANVLSLFGGLLGVGAGFAAAFGAGLAIHSALPGWINVLSLPAGAMALGAAAVTGALFGWLPAGRAARLDPVEALRR